MQLHEAFCVFQKLSKRFKTNKERKREGSLMKASQ
jgi:hypothetical protein